MAGVGRPSGLTPIAVHVLTAFGAEDRRKVDVAKVEAVEIIRMLLQLGLDRAMSAANAPKGTSKESSKESFKESSKESAKESATELCKESSKDSSVGGIRPSDASYVGQNAAVMENQ
jgi:hypothetical protein